MIKVSHLALLMVCLLAVFIAVGGCESQRKISDKNMQLADFQMVQDLVASKDIRTVVVDVSSPPRFQQEHIKGAFNIHMPLLSKRDRLLAGKPNIVVYSSGELNDNLSTGAAKRLLNLGYVNVYNYRGGLKDWVKNGGGTSSLMVEPSVASTDEFSSSNQ